MGIFARIVKKFIQTSSRDKKSDFIFYRIVDSSEDNESYLLQCVNTHGVFYSSLQEIIADHNILHGLHPIQACYMGIEYIKHHTDAILHTFSPELESRYGLYQLAYVDRANNIGFFHKETLEDFLMPVEKIVFSDQILEKFDAIEAFYIGTLAAKCIEKNLNKKAVKHLELNSPRKFKFTLIKGGK